MRASNRSAPGMAAAARAAGPGGSAGTGSGAWRCSCVFARASASTSARRARDRPPTRGQAQARRGRRRCAPRTRACATRRAALSAAAPLEREARRLGMVKPGEGASSSRACAARSPLASASLACGRAVRAARDQWQEASGGSRRSARAAPRSSASTGGSQRAAPPARRRVHDRRARRALRPGHRWCTDLAYAVAPGGAVGLGRPDVADAAFGRYLRRRPTTRAAGAATAAPRSVANAESATCAWTPSRGVRAPARGSSASVNERDAS